MYLKIFLNWKLQFTEQKLFKFIQISRDFDFDNFLKFSQKLFVQHQLIIWLRCDKWGFLNILDLISRFLSDLLLEVMKQLQFLINRLFVNLHFQFRNLKIFFRDWGLFLQFWKQISFYFFIFWLRLNVFYFVFLWNLNVWRTLGSNLTIILLFDFFLNNWVLFYDR